ncbi:MAG: M48 family metallopeptidase [archaeon]
METEKIELNGRTWPVHIHYEKRNNSRVSIGRTAINIRIPSSMDREERFREKIRMKNWALKKLTENKDRFRPEPKKEYKHGQIIKAGDEEYRLNISFKDKESSSAWIEGNDICFSLSSNLPEKKANDHISSLLLRLIAKKRLSKLEQKIHELNDKHFQKRINKISFKNNRSRWGSCSKKGNLNISARLLFAPEDVLEYICIHELAHLVEFNHSEKFWSLVGDVMPDYKDKHEWLRKNSAGITSL